MCCLRGCEGEREKEERPTSSAHGLCGRESDSSTSGVSREGGFTLVKRGSRNGPVLTGPRKLPAEEMNNRFSLLTPSEEEDGRQPGLTDSDDERVIGGESDVPKRTRRWKRYASQRRTHRDRQTISILKEIRGDTISGCSESAEEWEELELLVDSGASATVVGKDEVRAVAASDPDPSRHYKMADGSIIPHLGDKKVRAVTDELGPSGQYKVTDFRCSVADVDKPLLSVAHVIHNGGKVVFSQAGSYIEHASGRQN